MKNERVYGKKPVGVVLVQVFVYTDKPVADLGLHISGLLSYR